MWEGTFTETRTMSGSQGSQVPKHTFFTGKLWSNIHQSDQSVIIDWIEPIRESCVLMSFQE